MPTSEQLDLLWESQLEHFGGYNSEYSARGAGFEANYWKKRIEKFSGETIGILRFDLKNQDIVFEITNQGESDQRSVATDDQSAVKKLSTKRKINE